MNSPPGHLLNELTPCPLSLKREGVTTKPIITELPLLITKKPNLYPVNKKNIYPNSPPLFRKRGGRGVSLSVRKGWG